MKIGIGIDAHKFSPDRELVIGGVKIDYGMGLDGHSDADVLVHSIIDALLGSSGKGDIGKHFPDTDNRYKNISSMKLLEETLKIINMQIINIDSVIVCQKPKLQNYIDAMRRNIADVLKTDIDSISIKATTTEYMGFTGREEGILCVSIALMEKT